MIFFDFLQFIQDVAYAQSQQSWDATPLFSKLDDSCWKSK